MTEKPAFTYEDARRLYWENESGWITRPFEQADEIGRMFGIWREEELLRRPDELMRFELRIVYDVLEDTVRLTGRERKNSWGRANEEEFHPAAGFDDGSAIDITKRVRRYMREMDLRQTDRAARATVRAAEDAKHKFG